MTSVADQVAPPGCVGIRPGWAEGTECPVFPSPPWRNPATPHRHPKAPPMHHPPTPAPRGSISVLLEFAKGTSGDGQYPRNTPLLAVTRLRHAGFGRSAGWGMKWKSVRPTPRRWPSLSRRSIYLAPNSRPAGPDRGRRSPSDFRPKRPGDHDRDRGGDPFHRDRRADRLRCPVR